MKKFSFLVPSTIDKAISLLASHGEGARYMAGGTDVVVKIKEGKLSPDYLVSLRQIPELDRISVGENQGELRIGALTTHRMLETSTLIRWHYPILHDAVRQIGSVQIRNVATIGGNLVNAVPSADGAIPLITLDARVVLHGPKGLREMALLDFFLGPGPTILERGEILEEIVVPPLLPRTGSAYVKFGRREAMELPLLGVGVLLSLEGDGSNRCRKARIGLGVAAPTPIRALEAERFLEGKEVDEALLEEAGRVASEEARVRDSIRGVAWYRREMVRVLVRRMGLKCMERAREQSA
jgi:aerobic carbon-monoxide dehydrogenase medium subunit